MSNEVEMLINYTKNIRFLTINFRHIDCKLNQIFFNSSQGKKAKSILSHKKFSHLERPKKRLIDFVAAISNVESKEEKKSLESTVIKSSFECFRS